MSQKKLKKSKGSHRGSNRIIPDLDVQGGEGYYGIVEKILGGNIISVKLNDGTTKQARIPGKFRNKVWLRAGSKVLLNIDMEVVNIIRENDSKSSEVDRMLRNAGNDGNEIFQYGDDDDDEIEDDVLIKKPENINKLKEMLSKKETDKIKDSTRKGGRVIRDDDTIEKDISNLQLTNNKKETETTSNDEIINDVLNIDAI